MNWDKIRKDFPKAFQYMLDKKGWRWQGDDYATGVCYSGTLDSFIYGRVLYDFFDEQGILPIAEIDTTVEPKFSPTIYTCDPENLTELIWRDEFLYGLRPEAEEKAFEQSFKILEDRL